MKSVIFMLTILSTINAYACSCAEGNYTNDDRDMAVISFMETKLGIESNDLMAMRSNEGEGFLTLAQRGILKVTSLIDDSYFAECERACSAGVNGIYKYEVAYLANSEEKCFVDLKVTMTSSFAGSGFKSLVEQSFKPSCSAY